MEGAKGMAKPVVPGEVLRSSQPWLELDPNRDLSGLADGEETLFVSLEEKTAYYRQSLYGQRFSTAVYLKPEREFHQMTYVKAQVPVGGRLLLLGEALEPTGLVQIAHETLAPNVEVVALEMRPYIKAHGGENRHWPLFRELASDYREGEFDAVVASQMHHSDDYVPEFRALARLVKPGGKLVLVDYGPCEQTFELAKQDPILNWLLRTFVTWAGARRVTADRAYEYQKEIWLSAPMHEVVAACREVMIEPRLWEYKGMAIVDGVCKH